MRGPDLKERLSGTRILDGKTSDGITLVAGAGLLGVTADFTGGMLSGGTPLPISGRTIGETPGTA